jgi:RNA polymerase sigma-32 factor
MNNLNAMIPMQLNVGSIDAYISSINRLPMLSAAEEVRLAREYRDQENLDAAKTLVMSHLRLVASIARQYLGYGLPHADLIQEGNIGLMKAVKRYDPEQGTRLVTYSIHWIKAEIHEYILKNWRMVKIATTKAHRKLFFNLRSNKPSLNALSSTEIDHLAKALDVRQEDVREMEKRLAGGDVAIEANDSSDEDSFAPINWLSDDRYEPSQVLAKQAQDELQGPGIERALSSLDERSRRIISARWLNVSDDGSGASTLHELATEFNVSAERIRQIETAALKKMKLALTN